VVRIKPRKATQTLNVRFSGSHL